MRMERVPLVWTQIALFSLLFVAPFFFAVFISYGGTRMDSGSSFWGIVLAGLICFAAGSAVCGSMLVRRDIILTSDELVIKHTFYNLVLSRHDVVKANVRMMEGTGQMGIATKKNGVAAFGFYSGWFFLSRGGVIFCAVSLLPAYIIEFTCKHDCPSVAVSCTPAMAKAISEWVV